jgi:hypothetical protein
MRIRVIRKPPVDCIDGIQLNHFVPGHQYDVGAQLGNVLLAERWAEPVATDQPATVIPVGDLHSERTHGSPNLVREFYPPYYDGPFSVAADRRATARPRRGVKKS